MHNFVECGEFMLISPCLERFPTKFHNNLSMLHNFVAPVTIRAAST